MYCKKCGQEMGADLLYCPSCGAPVSQPNYNEGMQAGMQYNTNQYNQNQYSQNQYHQNQYNANQYNQNQYSTNQYNQNPYNMNPGVGTSGYSSKTASGKKPPYLAIGIIAAVVVVVGIVAYMLFFSDSGSGSSNYEGPIENFCSAIEKQSGSKIASIIPDEIFEALEEEEGVTKSDFIEIMDESLESMFAYYDYEELKVDYEILDEDELSKKEIKRLKEYYEDELDVDLDIDEAKELEVELIATIDGEEEPITKYFVVIKVGSKWYIDMQSMENLMY